MMSEAPLRHMTAEELLHYSHEPYKQELVGGMLHEMEPPGFEHGVVAARIAKDLMRDVDEQRIGTVVASEVGFHLASNPDTVRAPDVAFVRRERMDAVGVVSGYWPGAPDLAIEVVSPNDRFSAVEEKALEWLAAGAGAVLVVDPRLRTVTVFGSSRDLRVLQVDDRLDVGDVVRGWSPQVADFFV